MNRPRILLAEDNADHRQLIGLSMEDGCPDAELVSVQTGRELLNAVREDAFDCIVLDFNLPDAKADELLPRLTEAGCEIPVVVISSGEEQDIVVRSVRSGGVDFVSKNEALCGTVLWERILIAMDRRRRYSQERRQIKRRVRRLAKLVETDPLTGLANRHFFHRLMNGRRFLMDRRGLVCCAMMDVDHFKSINDSYGHPCGDRVLQAVADCVRACTRPGDVLIRWGGEEFLVLLPETPMGAAWIWAEQVRRAVAEMQVETSEGLVQVTVSIGLAQDMSSGCWEELVRTADDALLMAKTRGRNRICSRAMVTLEKWVENEAVQTTTDPQWLVERLVCDAGDLLGPTQREHLTQHGLRVANLAERIGRQLHLNGTDLSSLRRAGLFHDLGKFVLPEDILAKPGPLSKEEWACCRRHVSYGDEVIERLRLAPDSLTRTMHDQDPDHHSAVQTPVSAQILALADAYDAMTSSRPYRRALTPAEAWSELHREYEDQFDPQVLRAARIVLTDREVSFPAMADFATTID